MRRILLAGIAALLVALAAPTAGADEGVCVDDVLPPHVAPCVPTEVCLASVGDGCFDASDPKDVLRWVKGLLGPCTCDPID